MGGWDADSLLPPRLSASAPRKKEEQGQGREKVEERERRRREKGKKKEEHLLSGRRKRKERTSRPECTKRQMQRENVARQKSVPSFLLTLQDVQESVLLVLLFVFFLLFFSFKSAHVHRRVQDEGRVPQHAQHATETTGNPRSRPPSFSLFLSFLPFFLLALFSDENTAGRVRQDLIPLHVWRG